MSRHDDGIVSDSCHRFQKFRRDCEDLFAEEDREFEEECPMDGTFKIPQKLNENFYKVSPYSDIRHRILRALNEQSFSQPRFVADQIWRKITNPTDTPFPQKLMYLPAMKKGEMAQRNPFNLPSFYFHHGETLINKVHNPKKDKILGVGSVGKRIQILMDNKETIVSEVDDDNVEVILTKVKNEPYPQGGTGPVYLTKRISISETEVELKGKSLVFRHLKTLNKSKRVPMYLNDWLIANHGIRKGEIYTEDDETKVILLFESFFMATGTLVKSEKGPVCCVSELPGTYGTTDFQLSPDRKSMVRTCQVPAVEKKFDAKMEKKKMHSERRDLHQVVDHLKELLEKDENKNRTIHKKDKRTSLVSSLCGNFRLLNRLSDSLKVDIPKNRDWTPREKLVHLARTFFLEGQPHGCGEGNKCVEFEKFVENAEFWIHDKVKPLRDDLLAELFLQLRLATYAAVLMVSRSSTIPISTLELNMASRMTRIGELYECSMEIIIEDLLKLYESPWAGDLGLGNVALEILASRATPRDCSDLLHLYHEMPDEIMEVFKQNPHLILFGVKPLSPPMQFLREYLAWLDVELKTRFVHEVRNDISKPFSLVQETPTRKRTFEEPKVRSLDYWAQLQKDMDMGRADSELPMLPRPSFQDFSSPSRNSDFLRPTSNKKMRAGPGLLDQSFRNAYPGSREKRKSSSPKL